MYETVTAAVTAVRADVPLQANWSEKIDEDFKKRAK